jgi:hypothetical protein
MELLQEFNRCDLFFHTGLQGRSLFLFQNSIRPGGTGYLTVKEKKIVRLSVQQKRLPHI